MRELEWNLAMALNSGADVSDVSMPTFEPQEDILNIHRNINYAKHY